MFVFNGGRDGSSLHCNDIAKTMIVSPQSASVPLLFLMVSLSNTVWIDKIQDSDNELRKEGKLMQVKDSTSKIRNSTNPGFRSGSGTFTGDTICHSTRTCYAIKLSTREEKSVIASESHVLRRYYLMQLRARFEAQALTGITCRFHTTSI